MRPDLSGDTTDMAQNFVSCEAFHNHFAAGPLWSATSTGTFESAIDITDTIVRTTDIPFIDDQRPGQNWVASVVGYVQTSTGVRAAIQTIAGIDGWFIDGVYTDNGTTNAIESANATDIGIGRQTDQYRLAFSGDAKTAIDALAGDPNFVSVQITYSQEKKFRGYWNAFTTFGEFAQVPPNVIPANQNSTYINANSFIDGMLTKFQKGGRRYNLAPVGATPVYANECSFAAVDVTGWVTIETGDIGVGPGQIPVSVADNTAERFRYHPNTFFRNTEYVRGVAVRRGDNIALTATQQGSQPVGIYVNDTTIVDSKWLIMVDGELSIVNLHLLDAGISPKTPLQLWNQVWAPLLQGSDSVARAVELNSSFKLDRLSYLKYARMLDRNGSTTTQTNTPLPG